MNATDPVLDDESEPAEPSPEHVDARDAFKRGRSARRKRRTGPVFIEDGCTDASNGALFAALQDLRFRYVGDSQQWLMYDGKRWTAAIEGDLLRAAKDTAQQLLDSSVKVQDESQRKRAVMWALASASLSRLNSMVKLASSEITIETRSAELDRDPMVLNVLNGTIDLRTGDLRPHDRHDLITRMVPIAYDQNAAAPRWERFMLEVAVNDEQLVQFVQRTMGYSLCGLTREHALFLLYGKGCNGKSIFIEILRALLGDLATAAPMTTFTGSREQSSATNDLAMLRGARVVTVQESEEGAKFSEALVKQLTGGDAITARFLHKEFFTFTPTFKPWIATNHKPKVKGTDDGFWRRVRLIPFAASFLGREDKGLLDALRAELPGILAWAVRGCLEWQRNGLGSAEAVSDATKAYREDSDPLAQFIADRLVVHPDAKIATGVLYAAYTEWCQSEGDEPLVQRTFSKMMAEREGVQAARTTTWRGFKGVGERSGGYDA